MRASRSRDGGRIVTAPTRLLENTWTSRHWEKGSWIDLMRGCILFDLQPAYSRNQLGHGSLWDKIRGPAWNRWGGFKTKTTGRLCFLPGGLIDYFL